MAKRKELSLEKCFVKNKVQKRLKLINFSEIQITESFCCRCMAPAEGLKLEMSWSFQHRENKQLLEITKKNTLA